MNFEEKIIERLKRIEREVERLRVWERPAGGSGFGEWVTYTPTLVGWSSTTTLICKYLKMGKILFFSAIISGTSNSTTTTFTLPETAILTEYSGAMGLCVNNGSELTVAARYTIVQGSDICKTYTNMAYGTWTASGTKRVSVYGWIATN